MSEQETSRRTNPVKRFLLNPPVLGFAAAMAVGTIAQLLWALGFLPSPEGSFLVSLTYVLGGLAIAGGVTLYVEERRQR